MGDSPRSHKRVRQNFATKQQPQLTTLLRAYLSLPDDIRPHAGVERMRHSWMPTPWSGADASLGMPTPGVERTSHSWMPTRGVERTRHSWDAHTGVERTRHSGCPHPEWSGRVILGCPHPEWSGCVTLGMPTPRVERTRRSWMPPRSLNLNVCIVPPVALLSRGRLFATPWTVA